MAIKRHPDPEQTEEMREWLSELLDYMAEDAYQKAKFYDSKQRTRHAALTAWERYLKEYPDSKHADDVRARIEVLQIKDQK